MVSSRGSRHRKKGPGGPSRPRRSGRTTPSRARRHPPETSGLVDPTRDRLIATLLESAHRAAPESHPGRAPALELWAEDLAGSAYAADAMPAEFYDDLTKGLIRSRDPLAPAVLAALALAVTHDDAAALRRGRMVWIDDNRHDPLRARDDLGIGRPIADRAVTLDRPGEAEVSIVIGFVQEMGRHSVGLLVDEALGGVARDLWVGPPIEEVVARATSEGDLVLADVNLVEAGTRALAAIGAAAVDDAMSDDDLRMLPLLQRRLEAIPGLTPPRRGESDAIWEQIHRLDREHDERDERDDGL